VIIPPVQNKTLSKPFPGDGISFAIEGEPVSKGRPRFSQRGGKVRTYTPAKTLNAEQAVADAFRAAAPGYTYAPDGAYQVDVVFVSGTRRQRDVDNMLKLILDGLNGIAWADDHQVLRTVAEKGYDPGNARTVVTIRRVDVMAA
jgi:Holliday junction resolvase RusA-like endonuclease